jgi:hypothetical protein
MCPLQKCSSWGILQYRDDLHSASSATSIYFNMLLAEHVSLEDESFPDIAESRREKKQAPLG